jgi:hypothetical protein
MEKCRYCGEETLLTVRGIPVCLKRECDLAAAEIRGGINDMVLAESEHSDPEPGVARQERPTPSEQVMRR